MDFGWMAGMAFLFIVGLIMIFVGGGGFIFIGLIMCGISVFVIWRGIRKNNQTSQIRQQINIKFLGSNNIELINRTPNNTYCFRVLANRDVTIHHRPEEIVYTGATVGGITTGGFHINPEENTPLLGEKTGTYYIWFNDSSDTGRVIKNIRIQPEMVADAKRNPIVRQFMDKNGRWLELKHKTSDVPPPEIVKAAQEYEKQGRWDMGAKLLRPYTIKTELSKEECEAVVSWMCGK